MKRIDLVGVRGETKVEAQRATVIVGIIVCSVTLSSIASHADAAGIERMDWLGSRSHRFSGDRNPGWQQAFGRNTTMRYGPCLPHPTDGRV